MRLGTWASVCGTITRLEMSLCLWLSIMPHAHMRVSPGTKLWRTGSTLPCLFAERKAARACDTVPLLSMLTTWSLYLQCLDLSGAFGLLNTSCTVIARFLTKVSPVFQTCMHLACNCCPYDSQTSHGLCYVLRCSVPTVSLQCGSSEQLYSLMCSHQH